MTDDVTRVRILDNISLSALPELAAFEARMTGSTTYSFDEDPLAAINAATFRDAAYVKVVTSNPLVFQYDAMLGVKLWRDFMRYYYGTKDGDGNLTAASTTYESEADQMMDKFQDYQLGYLRAGSSGNIGEPYACASGFANAYLDAYSSPTTGAVTIADFETMTDGASSTIGNPEFSERPNGTYTDANSVTQNTFDMDIPAQRFVAYSDERVICGVNIGKTNNTITKYDVAAGYANGATMIDTPVYDSKVTQLQTAWIPHHLEFLFYELKGASTDGPTVSFMPHATGRKWLDPDFLTAHGWRWSPWITGISAQVAVMYMEWLEGQSLPLNTSWLGNSGFSNIFDQLADFYEWAWNDSIVHPSNPANASTSMVQTDAQGYDQFRFADRNDDGGSTATDITAISTQFGCVYGWLGKKLALGDATLGIAQDIQRAEEMFAKGDQIFASSQDQDPYLNYTTGGIYRLKEHWQIYNPCLKYYFWRLEAQGIYTGRSWV